MRGEALALLSLTDGRVELVEFEDLELSIPGAFSPDGSTLVVSRRAEGQGVPLIESRRITLASGQRLSLVLVREARALFVRRDSRCIATLLPAVGQSAGEHPRDLVIFDLSRAEALHRVPPAAGAFLAVSPSSHGPIVTTASGDLEFRAVNSGTVNRVVSWSEEPVNGVVVSGDGTHLLATDETWQAALIDPDTGSVSQAITGLSSPVTASGFLPGRPDLVLGLGNDQVLHGHPRPLSEPPQPNGHDDEVWDVSFSDG